ncbi:cytochrome P450 [Mycolicibacterium sp. 120266]|uniref:cytochrome P450 n=1 Tax=Mycolicibacterium sp. 120266 TaxID=3090601 RepID=UPI00299DF2C0|nr:cytochrome P450 [Mycolicibacterium sp. 120266]MDX1873912.1 cytochrome P450 [Mycolicibacterium sp. 120266]
MAVLPLDGALGLALFDDDNVQNPHPLYARMHSLGPVHRIGDSQFFAVSGWNAVQAAIARSEDFSSNLTATMTCQGDEVAAFPMGELGGPTQILATADEPAHSVHRKMILPRLAAKRMRALEPFIVEATDEIWRTRFGDSGEWMSSMANRLPMLIVARIIGVPESDIDQLIRWGYAATQFVEGLVSPDQLAAAGADVMALGGYITDQFQRAAGQRRDDLLGDLAAANVAGDIDDIAALTMMITLFSAGGESTASLIGTAAWILATDPETQQQLRNEPDLLPAFLEEVLRFEPPFRGHYRHVLRDTHLEGVDLPEGSRLLLLWGAANRDPAQFTDPDHFRLDRPGAKGHLSFGKGAHFCVGAALARLEATLVIGELIKRTRFVEATQVGRWLPSLLVRRLERLDLRFV